MKEVISGFFILLEDSIAVCDVVEIAGVSGVVEEVKLRAITRRDVSGSVHIVPNGIVDRVKNMTKGYSYYVFDIGVAYREDVDHVMGVLVEIVAELRADPVYAADILDPLEMLGLDRFDDSAVIIRCRLKTVPTQQWRIGREMNRRIKKTFDAKGIEIMGVDDEKRIEYAPVMEMLENIGVPMVDGILAMPLEHGDNHIDVAKKLFVRQRDAGTAWQ